MILRTADRALAILEVMAEVGTPIKVGDLADRLEINLSTAYHLVNTLAARNFVIRANGLVSLGGGVATVAAAYNQGLDIVTGSRPVIERLSEAVDETCYLGTCQHRALVIRTIVEPRQSVRVGGLQVGYSGREYVRASGRAVLAQLPEAELDEYLANLTDDERALIDERRLTQDLHDVRENNLALERDQFRPGVSCLAAAFFDADGAVHGALAVSVPTGRLDGKRESIEYALREAIEKVHALTGFRMPSASGTVRETV